MNDDYFFVVGLKKEGEQGYSYLHSLLTQNTVFKINAVFETRKFTRIISCDGKEIQINIKKSQLKKLLSHEIIAAILKGDIKK